MSTVFILAHISSAHTRTRTRRMLCGGALRQSAFVCLYANVCVSVVVEYVRSRARTRAECDQQIIGDTRVAAAAAAATHARAEFELTARTNTRPRTQSQPPWLSVAHMRGPGFWLAHKICIYSHNSMVSHLISYFMWRGCAPLHPK